MKILFVSSWYPSPANPSKGIFVKKHAASVKSSGVDIRVLALSLNYNKSLFYQKNIYEFTDENGVPTHLIEINSRFYKWLHVLLPFQYFVLKRFYKTRVKNLFEPDVIHSNVIYPAGIMGYWLAKNQKKNSVITEHWTRLPKFFSKSVYRQFAREAYHRSVVTAVSAFLKNDIVNTGVHESRVRIIPNTIEPYFSYKEKKDRNELVFVCCANWNSHKRPDLIFNALQSVSKNLGETITLEVVGEGHLLEHLKPLTWNFKVVYHGFKDSEDLAGILQKADYFLHASMMETFSVVVAEALSCGIPVLASNVGALPELVKAHNGVLCENSKEAWMDGLKNLLSKKYDSEKISAEMKKFHPERVGKAFCELYKEILRVN